MKGKYKRKKQGQQAGPESGTNPEKVRNHPEEKGRVRTDDGEGEMTKRWHEPANIIQSIGIGIGTIVAVIYLCQLLAMREQVKLSRQAMEVDERPYVWDSNVKPQTTVVAGQRMWANLNMIDYGKAPALRVRVTGEIFIGPDAKQWADKWFDALGDKEFTDPSQSETVIPPGIPSLTPEQEKSGQGFGGGGYFTIMSDNVLKQPDVDYILNTEESAVIVARVQYFDGFGNRYWSNICLSRFLNGAMPHCTRHNEIH